MKSVGDVRRRQRPSWLLAAALSAWIAGVVTTMVEVWRYKSEPGARADAPSQWPAASAIERDPARITLVMFAHPLCACTAASLAELRRLAADPHRVAAHVLFLLPGEADASWGTAANWDSARSIPGVVVRADRNGTEAARFGALTSGHVVAYATDGTLLFSGGITNTRGHVGECLAATGAILGGSGTAETPVFGCSFSEPR